MDYKKKKNGSHDLKSLFIKLKSLLKEKYKADIPSWFEDLILAFHKFDPGGTSFRYEGTDPFAKDGELWVDVRHLKKLMDWLVKAFHNIIEAQNS